MKLKLHYDSNTTVQALCYLASHAPSKSLDKLEALKLLYLADRDHLRTHARTIIGDKYRAMKFGPVAVKAKRLIEDMAKTGGDAGGYLSVEKLPDKSTRIRPLRQVGMGALSQTDVESLNRAVWQLYIHPDIIAFTHRFPEWKKHETEIQKRKGGVPMDYLDFFLPCEDASDEYCGASKELVGMSRQVYQEESEWFE